jgi:hypothetical protein
MKSIMSMLFTQLFLQPHIVPHWGRQHNNSYRSNAGTSDNWKLKYAKSPPAWIRTTICWLSRQKAEWSKKLSFDSTQLHIVPRLRIHLQIHLHPNHMPSICSWTTSPLPLLYYLKRNVHIKFHTKLLRRNWEEQTHCTCTTVLTYDPQDKQTKSFRNIIATKSGLICKNELERPTVYMLQKVQRS